MSRFIELYRERQDKKWELRKIRRRASPEEYLKLKGEIDKIGEQLNQIIKDEQVDNLRETEKTIRYKD